MDIEIALTLVALVMLVGPPLVTALFLRGRQATWGSFGFGSLSFVASLFLRVPLFYALGWLMSLPFIPLLPEWAVFLFYASALALIAGVTEEWARYWFLHSRGDGGRRHDETIAFGLGHGGIEAMLIGVAILVFVWQGSSFGVDTLTLGGVQIASWFLLLPLFERVCAMLFHVAATLWVSFSIRVKRARLVWLAILAHAGFNLVAMLVSHFVDPISAELALGLVTLLAVAPALVAFSAMHRRLDKAS